MQATWWSPWLADFIWAVLHGQPESRAWGLRRRCGAGVAGVWQGCGKGVVRGTWCTGKGRGALAQGVRRGGAQGVGAAVGRVSTRVGCGTEWTVSNESAEGTALSARQVLSTSLSPLNLRPL
eukprot:365097-Chlamydomonas_euryale.AAC.2